MSQFDFQPLTGLVGRMPSSFEPERAPGEIDKNGFLNLLIEQMKNQDPMNPMESTEYSAQLASFTTLEEMQNQSSLLDQGLQADILLAQSINNTLAGTLVGKEVKAVGDQVTVLEGQAGNISFEVNGVADDVEIRIVDATGTTRRTLNLGQTFDGEQTVQWDGRDDAGRRLADGNYTVEIDAISSDGSRRELAPYIIGLVDAVRYESSGAVLIVDGVRVGFGDVLELREPGDTLAILDDSGQDDQGDLGDSGP